jgi:hypothetical protein
MAVFYARARRFSSSDARDHLRRRRQIERHQSPSGNTATLTIPAMISAAASVSIRWAMTDVVEPHQGANQ